MLEQESQLQDEKPIIPAHTALETFRDSGYKHTASAIAELIDNSIEAKANHVKILAFEKEDYSGQRKRSVVNKIAVYDDGEGMGYDTLALSLQFGVGTRMHSRKGMGRFGIGLPNASVSQCRRVTVYSWQNGVCRRVYLDIDEVKDTKVQNSIPPEEVEIPQNLTNYLGEISISGTLVVWEKCDRLDLKKGETLYKHMSKDLCRIYRHFLDDDDQYGKKVSINYSIVKEDSLIMSVDFSKDLSANDPLFLLTPNINEGYEEEATSVSQGKEDIEIPYNDKGDTSKIEIRYSIAKPHIQAEGGNSSIGKAYRDNNKISFVRACREIDFDVFNFFNEQQETQRWWGCEVRFDPIFG